MDNEHSPESCWGMLDSVSPSSMPAAEAITTAAAANKPVVVVAKLQQLVFLLLLLTLRHDASLKTPGVGISIMGDATFSTHLFPYLFNLTQRVR